MECHACEIIHVLGPYVLVAFFAIFIYRIIKRHQDTYAQMHARTMDVFERQNTVYERVHFDLVALKKNGAQGRRRGRGPEEALSAAVCPEVPRRAPSWGAPGDRGVPFPWRVVMNPQKKEKLIWFLLGGLVGMVLTIALECCSGGPPPPPPAPAPCADAAAVSDAAVEAGADDAAPPVVTPLAFDAGPSCGTHPWCKDKHPCCLSPGNCCQ